MEPWLINVAFLSANAFFAAVASYAIFDVKFKHRLTALESAVGAQDRLPSVEDIACAQLDAAVIYDRLDELDKKVSEPAKARLL